MSVHGQGNGSKAPKSLVRLGIVVMLLGVAPYLFFTANGHSVDGVRSVLILLLIAIGFVVFTLGTVRYFKALEAEAKRAIEQAEQEKAYGERSERTEKQKKREELDAMLAAGLIRRDEYDCARKKYEE